LDLIAGTNPEGNVSVVCLPQFIIAGTQKSGTTLFSALLSEHAGISFSPKKEVHFFDRGRYFKQGVEAYLKAFKAWNYSTSPQSTPAPPVYGEATPFYVASPDACRRIAKTLPGIKMIILLREPVSRAYSEYQMKRRRVATQNEFILAMMENEEDVYSCMVSHREDWKALKACMPEIITSHSHYPKFVSSLKTILKDGAGGWASVLSKCFSRYAEGSTEENIETAHHMSTIPDDSTSTDLLYATQATSSLDLYLNSDPLQGRLDLSSLLNQLRLPDYTFSPTSSEQKIDTRSLIGKMDTDTLLALNRSFRSIQYKGVENELLLFSFVLFYLNISYRFSSVQEVGLFSVTSLPW